MGAPHREAALDNLRRRGAVRHSVPHPGVQRRHRLHAANRGTQEPAGQVRVHCLLLRRPGARPLLPQYRQPRLRRLRRNLAGGGRRAHFDRGRPLRGPLRHRPPGHGPRGRQDPPVPEPQRRRRLDHHPAAGQAALHPGQQQHPPARDAEAYRMDDRRKARALLFEGGNPEDVPQPVRLPL